MRRMVVVLMLSVWSLGLILILVLIFLVEDMVVLGLVKGALPMLTLTLVLVQSFRWIWASNVTVRQLLLINATMSLNTTNNETIKSNGIDDTNTNININTTKNNVIRNKSERM